MGLTVASILNGFVWMTYSTLVRDIYVFIPNICALVSAAINFNLYQWTQGKMDNNHWFILFLQYKFNVKGNKALKVLPDPIDEEIAMKKDRKKRSGHMKKFDTSNETNTSSQNSSTDRILEESTNVTNRKNLSS